MPWIRQIPAEEATGILKEELDAAVQRATGKVWDEWLALEQQAEAAALRANDLYSAGWRVDKQARIHSMRGQSEQLLLCADRVESHWRETADGVGVRERATAKRIRGIAHHVTGNYPAAIELYRESLTLYRSAGRDGLPVWRRREPQRVGRAKRALRSGSAAQSS